MSGLKGCVICGEGCSHIRVVYEKVEPRVLECTTCHLRYVDSSPSNDDLPVLYDGYIEVFARSVYESQMDTYEEDSIIQLKKIEALVGTQGRILDVGCGYGHFLAAARDRGYEVAGVDIAGSAVEHGRRLLGSVVQQCSLEKADYSPAWFDVITMWDLIEHLPDPNPTLLKAIYFLREGGILIIRTPSSASLVSKISHVLYRITGGKASSLVRTQYNHFHLFRYSPETLSKLMIQCGFDIVKISRENSSYPIFVSMHPRFARGLVRRSILRLAFAVAIFFGLQNKFVLTARKAGLKANN